MTFHRMKLAATAIAIAVMAVILLWSHQRRDRAEVQRALDQMDRDASDAVQAAAQAHQSAVEAIGAANAARNALPGSS